jgi:hypothetical protein
MKNLLAVTVLWLVLLPCSSRGTDLFHITADEQLMKFQDLFRSLLSWDDKSLSKMIARFVIGNDPEGTDQEALYDHDNFIDFLSAPWSDYDHISVTVDEESLTTKTQFRCGQSRHSGQNGVQETSKSEPYVVAISELIYECNMRQKNTGNWQKARMRVSMDNIYTDDYPDGIITSLYFDNAGLQTGNMSSAGE